MLPAFLSSRYLDCPEGIPDAGHLQLGFKIKAHELIATTARQVYDARRSSNAKGVTMRFLLPLLIFLQAAGANSDKALQETLNSRYSRQVLTTRQNYRALHNGNLCGHSLPRRRRDGE